MIENTGNKKGLSAWQRLVNTGKESPRIVRYRWNLIRGVRIDSPPVFIVGCAHSGTWLLLAILGAHSRIYAVPFESRIVTKKNQELFQKTLKKFDRMAVTNGKNRWVEKTPMHIDYIGTILEWCPDARILIMIRDGRDVAHSLKARHGGSIENGIQRWMQANRAGEKYWSHPQVFVLRYEDLVTDFESTVRKMLHFLHEEYEEQQKEFYKFSQQQFPQQKEALPLKESAKDNQYYRKWQISQPLFDGRGRWKEMSNEELALVNEIGGEMLRKYGYMDDASPKKV